MVIAPLRAKPGSDGDLVARLRDRQPALRRERLATERPSTVLRAQDGTLLEFFERTSQEAS
jgi:hypothetical protein